MSYTSYHVHTFWSDGESNIEAMVAEAERQGFAEIGISDHCNSMPEREVEGSMHPKNLDSYFQVLTKFRENARLPLKIGLEIDFFPEAEAEKLIERIRANYPVDYLIGSVHMVENFPVDHSPADWEKLSESKINEVYTKYWRAMRRLVETQLFEFVGHLDLPKKFNYRPTRNMEGEIEAVFDRLERHDTMLEINTAGLQKQCEEQYPSSNLLRVCRDRRLPLIINDDAHAVSDLGQYFSSVHQLVYELEMDFLLCTSPWSRT